MAKPTAGLIKRTDLDKLREKLRNMPAMTIENKQELTIKEAITLLREDLIELRDKRNYTLSQLCDHLATQGISVSPPTLKAYIDKKRRKKGLNDTARIEETLAVPPDKPKDRGSRHDVIDLAKATITPVA
jgi:hypothetical protein